MMAVYYSPLMEELKTRNVELSAEVEELKHQVDKEKIKLKNAKEEKVGEIKLAREQEQTNAAQEKEELKRKLQRQMQSELMTKVDATRKEFEMQIALNRKENKKEIDTQKQKFETERRQLEEKLQLEENKFKEGVLTTNKKEADKFIAEVFQLQEQLSVSQGNIDNLKQENKRLKDNLLKQKENSGKEAGQTDKQFRADHQKQIEELREKDRQLIEKDRQLSELRRKCTSLEIAKEKVENDLQLSKRLTTITPGTAKDKEKEGGLSEPQIPTKTQREEELLITNSELGVLVKRMSNELQQLKKEKAIVDGKLKTAEGVVEPLKKRREEDMKTILELNHMVDVKEKHLQKIANERNGLKTERDKLKKDLETEQAALTRVRTSDKQGGEITRLKQLLGTKNKEIDELKENNAKLNTDLHKLKENTDRMRKGKAELRLNQLSSSAPHSPAVERKVKEHRRLVELEQTMKETSDKLFESQCSRAKINQKMEDLNESLRRRDKRIKAITEENHRFKSSNHLLEEARDRTYQETIEEWTRTRTELDSTHAQNNRLHQENMNLRDELAKYTTSIPTSPGISYLSMRQRSRSPSPRQRSDNNIEQRARSLSPSRRFSSQRNLRSPSPGQEPSPQLMSPDMGLRPPSQWTPSSNTGHQIKIPIATRYLRKTSPHQNTFTTPTSDHTSQAQYPSPRSPISPTGRMVSPPIRSPSPHTNSFSSPRRSIVVTLPQAEIESFMPLPTGYQDDDFGSEVSMESMKDRIELYEFEKEETKIWQDEQMEEFRQLKEKHKILKERYNSLLNRAKSMNTEMQLAHMERLEMDREVARLQAERGGEFDIKREGNLRDKLNQTNKRVKELEEELTIMTTEEIIENDHEELTDGHNDDKKRMDKRLLELREHLEQFESQLKNSESQLAKKEDVIKTKEKQMVGLERMLAEKEGELEGERAIITSLQQQVNNGILSASLPRQQPTNKGMADNGVPSPWQQRHTPQLVNCIDSAQNVTREVKKSVKSDLTDDQVEHVEGLIEYVYQVLEEAKGHVHTPIGGHVPTPIGGHIGGPIATPTEGYNETDSTQFDNAATDSSNAEQYRNKTTPTIQLLPVFSKQDSNEAINKTLRTKISQLEAQIQYLTEILSRQDDDDSVKEELLLLQQQAQEQTSQHEKEKQSMLLQVHQLQLLLSKNKQQEKVRGDAYHGRPGTTTTTQQLILPSPTQVSAEKDEKFKQWMKKFENEKISLNKRIQELETRLGEGSQRVIDLQSLVMELEGRLSDELDPERISPISPSTIKDRDRYIISLTEKISQLEEQLERWSPDNHLTTHPTSLGLEVNRSFQHTQYCIEQGDLPRSRLELQHLERSISELLRAVYPEGSIIVSPVSVEPLEYENPWSSISPVYTQTAPLHATPTHVTPSLIPISSISPITLSSSEPDLAEVYTQTIGGMEYKATPTDTKLTNQSAKKSGIRLFVTLLDYNPLSLCSSGHPEKELTLHTGDVIAVTGDMDADGFYNGIFEGHRGLVPAKFLEEMEVTDKGAQQRLLNQSLSHTLSPSLHGSEVDLISSPSTHKVASQILTPILASRGTRPSPPSQLNVEKSGHCLLVTWRSPTLDVTGRSNGCLVTGYSLLCDSIPVHTNTTKETSQYTKQVLLEVNTNIPHTVTICTMSEEGVASTEVTVQYDPVSIKYSSIRSSLHSNGSVDSDIIKTKLMVAVYDYNPVVDSPNVQPDLELSFVKGEIIIVYGAMRDDGFYHGQIGDLYGLVPSNFVNECDLDEQGTRPLISDISLMINPAHVRTPTQQRSKRKLFAIGKV